MKKYQYMLRNMAKNPISWEFTLPGGLTDWISMQDLSRTELAIISLMFLIAFLLVIK
jgi:hypothetical protein